MKVHLVVVLFVLLMGGHAGADEVFEIHVTAADGSSYQDVLMLCDGELFTELLHKRGFDSPRYSIWSTGEREGFRATLHGRLGRIIFSGVIDLDGVVTGSMEWTKKSGKLMRLTYRGDQILSPCL
jgi:hypothetical protein